MILHRVRYESNGTFGHLLNDDYSFLFYTLEHAYEAEDGDFFPKIPSGTYMCVRGQHQLEGMNEPFNTFEITGAPNHSGILFHAGNTNGDSNGCVLLGEGANLNGVVDSRRAFESFMNLLQNVDSFELTVI